MSAAKSKTSKPAPQAAGTKRIVGDKWFGCTSRDDRDQISGYAVEHDMDAFKKSLAAGIVLGRCTLFNDGEPVFLEDTAIFAGLLKVRRPGETQAFWTNFEAVK